MSLKYVDLQDLTWVTGLSGAEISAHYQTKLPHNVPQPIGVAQTNVVVVSECVHLHCMVWVQIPSHLLFVFVCVCVCVCVCVLCAVIVYV